MINKDKNTKVSSIIAIELDKKILDNAKQNNRSKSQEIAYVLNKYYNGGYDNAMDSTKTRCGPSKEV